MIAISTVNSRRKIPVPSSLAPSQAEYSQPPDWGSPHSERDLRVNRRNRQRRRVHQHLFSAAIAIGDGAEAHASGTFGAAFAVGRGTCHHKRGRLY